MCRRVIAIALISGCREFLNLFVIFVTETALRKGRNHENHDKGKTNHYSLTTKDMKANEKGKTNHYSLLATTKNTKWHERGSA